MIPQRQGRERRSVEAVIGGVAAEEKPVVGLAVEALHVRSSRPPACFHRCADELRVLDIREDHQVRSGCRFTRYGLRVRELLEELLLIHRPPP